MVSGAYWISPSGKIFTVWGTHIQDVASDPKKFGTTIEKIKAEYAKHNEFFPKAEGKARETIMRAIVKKGWIRARLLKRTQTWVLETWKWSTREKNAAWDWAYKVTNAGKNSAGVVKFISVAKNAIVGKNSTLNILRYKGDMFESLRKEQITEASLSRIWRDYQENEFGIITSWRKEKDKITNEANLSKIKNTIRSSGFGYVRLEGVGQEEIGGKIVSVKEPSLLVKNIHSSEPVMDTEKFEKFMIGLGEKYEQWGIVLSHPTKGTRLVANGNVVQKFSKFSPTSVGKFLSKIRGTGKSFKFEGLKYADYDGFLHGSSLEREGAVDILRGETQERWMENILSILQETEKALDSNILND